LIAKGDEAGLQEAVALLGGAAEKDPRLAFLRRQQAIAYGRLGRLAEADLMLAEEALLLGNRQQAARFARRVLDRPDLPAAWASRAADIQFLAEQTGGQK
jgi:predicted Zn-dependent protease